MKFKIELVKTDSYTAEIIVEAEDLASAENIIQKKCWDLGLQPLTLPWLYEDSVVECYHIDEIEGD